jgi:hypothetical protein
VDRISPGRYGTRPLTLRLRITTSAMSEAR